MRLSKLSNVAVQLLIEVCNNVKVEPTLQTLTRWNFAKSSANVTSNVRLAFWTKHQMEFSDAKIFHPNAKS